MHSAKDIHLGFAHSCSRASLWAPVAIELGRAPGPLRLSEDGLATVRSLPLPPHCPASPWGFSTDAPGIPPSPYRKDAPSPPSPCGVLHTRHGRPRALENDREQKECFKTRLCYFPSWPPSASHLAYELVLPLYGSEKSTIWPFIRPTGWFPSSPL